MRVDKICYEQLWPTGQFSNQRYRVEATVDWEKDDIIECYKTLKSCVEKTFTELNPQIQWSDQPHPIPGVNQFMQQETKPPEIQIEKPLGVTVEDINSCTEKKILETYRFVIKGKPTLEKAYLDKMGEFLTKESKTKTFQ